MQKVSTAYKNSMKEILRERGYIKISFGVVNLEAQANATIEDGDYTYYSNDSTVFDDGNDDTVYATLEEDFTKVDGSMYFLPREDDAANYYNTGLVSNGLVSDGQVEVGVDLNIVATDFKGITIDFGENYPTDFDFVLDTGLIVEVRDNTDSEFYTEEVMEDVTSFVIVVYAMKNEQTRFRIYSIKFGYGLVYTNDSITDSSLEMYVSPIGEDVPQIDFSVTLINYDQYFNVDNPNSVVNFLETGQEMDIYYGYQIPDSDIEWIKGGHLLCSEWESDDYKAIIRCQDIFRTMDSEYYKGTYQSSGISLYDLALEVIEDADIEDYYIDSHLKTLYTKNPLPRVTHKEALQIIANAGRCTLSQDRDGVIQIKSNFAPDATASSNGETEYSNVENILTDDTKDEYATLIYNYVTADAGMYFLPSDSSNANLNTGYVSSEMSDADGLFTTNPIVTIVQEAACKYYGLKMTFGYAIPSGIIFRTYLDGELVDEYEVTDEITKTFILLYSFSEFDTMEVEFTGTEEPYSRIVLNNFAFGDTTDFTMERLDMTSSPTAIKQELISNVVVSCYSYQATGTNDTLVSEEITVSADGEQQTYYLGDACYGYAATLDESSSGVSIVASGAYYVTLEFDTAGDYQLDITGYRYTIVEKYSTNTLNSRGTSVSWANPLISDMDMADDLAEWLGDYYSAGIEYEYDTRGNPEIDANDIVYQENDFVDDMKVCIYRHTINFANSFSGSVVARRQVSS